MLIQDYASYSNPKMKIGRLVKEGKLIPIIQGIYETDKSIPGYYLSGIIYDPSYLSFEFALSWYGLIPETVYNYTSASYSKKKKKEYDTYFGRFTYRDVPTSVYPYGTKIIEENGYEICGNIRERYIDGVWNKDTEEEWLSEIQIPVRKIK